MTESKESKKTSLHTQMLINYVPGEECRVAVVENGKLEEFHAERAASISRVGNIYVGRVTNVEPAIQAAFVDFGVEHHGFLHVTDVHPRYFPGEDDETTERVGKKTPRRERPPIQRCFRRGDEVLVQVLKEGVGTKGPTLTSYLSIPGRFLVMMPQMDKVGVSRKVEDEDQRKQMREILDQLDLPEGFGFILRTAGMDRNKTELKRDLAYLTRLWKDMEARRTGGSKPRLLYSESDLLVRALRDMLSPEINEVVIDNDLALARAARFLKIVAPRSKVKLLQYEGKMPLFHAFGVEQQIAMMHAREVPLPSGGRLVIDETEALVAIDVNSGRMRDARDAETNAYRTNCEAVEEICRQLKLRDLGGIVINDLIDMRLASHRKDIENRFKERLKRDRARTTTLQISSFGILEMTRQRMRGSHETLHFIDCPTCRGRGIIQKPDSIAADAMRNMAAILDHENVARVEMVVSPRVASELLSSRRKSLTRLERALGKTVDVRVSEAVPLDRVTFYAYDASGADIEIDSLPRPKAPSSLKVWELSISKDEEAGWASDMKEEEVPVEPELTPAEQAELEEMPAHPIEFDEEEGAEGAPGEGGKKRRRRRRRRGGRGRGEGEEGQRQPAGAPGQDQEREEVPSREEAEVVAGEREASPRGGGPREGAPREGAREGGPRQEGEEGGGRRRRRRRRRGRGGQGGPEGQGVQGGPEGEGSEAEGEALEPAAQAESAPEDEFAPRGDSWDLEPAAVKPLPVQRPQPASEDAEPGHVEPEPQPVPAVHLVEGEEEEEAEEGELVAAGAPAPEVEGDDPTQRRKRRRRRRRGRGGQGEGGEAGAGGGEQPSPEREQPAPQAREQRPPQKQERLQQQSRQQKPQQPAPRREAPAPEPKPQPKPQPAAAPKSAPEPATAGGKKPKLLYTSRRKLSPAEAAKRPRE